MQTTPNIGVIGIPGKWSTETLADAVESETGFRLVVDMADVTLDLERQALNAGGHNLCELDALIVKKISAVYSPGTLDRLELLRVAENAGVRVFSPADSMLRLIKRLSCTVTLGNVGIPMPETRVTEDIDAAVAAVREFGSAVFKPLYSTKARGMCIIDADQPPETLEQAVHAFRQDNPMMYIQRRIDLPGRDLGMVFLGGEYLGTYARVPQGDAWNTTIHSGGRYEAYAPPADLIQLALRAQAPFGMDFTTVDVAETAEGPIVFEVSAFGGFRGALEGAGIDAAAAAEMRTWQHGGGWSIDASVRVADWDRHALERLVRYCARPPLASGRLGRLNADTLVYRLRRPLLDGRTEILLRPVDLLARLVDLLTPPRKHRHRYCGVLAPAARLRRAVTATAGPAGTVSGQLPVVASASPMVVPAAMGSRVGSGLAAPRSPPHQGLPQVAQPQLPPPPMMGYGSPDRVAGSDDRANR